MSVFGLCCGRMYRAITFGCCRGSCRKRAGSHWQARDLLPQFGAITSNERMTIDGKFYTSGGVTSGIDIVFRLVADIAGLETAQKI